MAKDKAPSLVEGADYKGDTPIICGTCAHAQPAGWWMACATMKKKRGRLAKPLEAKCWRSFEDKTETDVEYVPPDPGWLLALRGGERKDP